MILKVNNKKFDFFTKVNVSLKHNSVASTFSFEAYFNPQNPDHKALFLPTSFADVVVEHNNERLITGTLLTSDFESGATVKPISIAGYSKTGVLEDCEIPTEAYPLQANGVSFKSIAERILKPFGLKLVVDTAVSSKANENYTVSTSKHEKTAKAYLCELAAQRGLFVTHDNAGNLLLTESKTHQAPIFDFVDKMPGISYKHSFNGQDIHSKITVIRQAGEEGGNAGQQSVTNPYAGKSFRPHIVKQTSGNDNHTQKGARNLLSEELKADKLVIIIDRWELNGKLLRPNQMITVQNDELYIYNKTKFFIETVDLYGDSQTQTATITCCLPEVFNTDTPKNIFL